MNKRINAKKWYEKPWGIIAALLIFPFFLIYYAWSESKWSHRNKFITTIVALFIIGLLFVDSSSKTETITKNVQGIQVVDMNTISSLESAEIIQTIPGNSYSKYNLEMIEDKTLYKVTEIIDGDTIKVFSPKNETLTVRMIGIDTPETKDPQTQVQCFGLEATENAKRILESNNVYLIPDETQDDSDKYNRVLRYVVREDGYFYNLNTLADGYANEYTFQEPYKFQEYFIDASANARKSNLGLFGTACKCSNENGQEVNRECSSCNTASVEVKNLDCSIVKKVIEDSSCSNLCEPDKITTSTPTPTPLPQTFSCNCSKTCSQMGCSEAQFQLNQCGCTRRDGDGDGIACDSSCE